MSAFLYTLQRELFCLNVDDYEVQNGLRLKQIASECCGGIPVEKLFVIHNGHVISDSSKVHLKAGDVCYTALHLPGGKGGFGSMLRALGAQIEKTTNREACRDLSGRRMRDINDEKKIAEWVSKQAEREREKEKQKQLRMERKRQMPKHTFDDATYTQHIQDTCERIEDALQQGLKAAGSSASTSTSTSSQRTAVKRVLADEPSTSSGGKKSRMLLGMDDLDSDEDDDVLVTSRDDSKDIPALRTSTATSSTSTHAEPSTPCSDFENRHCMESRTEEIVGENELEGETKDQTKDFQEKDSDSPPQTINQEGGPREDRVSEKDKVTDIQPAEKVEFCLDDYTSAEELESVGIECLKEELMSRGLKCGGTLQQRAQRLFATQGVPLDQLDPSFFAKPTGKKKSNGKKK